jgi:hypothetical protein
MAGLEAWWEPGRSAETLLHGAALSVSHACAGASWVQLWLRRSARRQGKAAEGWLQRPSRIMVLVSAGLMLPLLAWVLLAFTSRQEPETALLHEAFGSVLLLLLACPFVFVGAWAASLRARTERTISGLEVVACAAGLLGVALAGALQGFLLHPGEWLEHRTLEAVVFSPIVVVTSAWRVAIAVLLGLLVVRALSTGQQSGAAQAHADRLVGWALAAVLCVGVAQLTAWVWVARGGATDALLGVPRAWGVHGARAGRLLTLAALGWAATLGVLAVHAASARARSGAWVLAALAMVSACAAEHGVRSWNLPWSAPGLLYANGVLVEQVRTARRSPQFELGHSQEWLGPAMFVLRCGGCHHAAGPQRGQLKRQGFAATRTMLQQLGEADQYGSPYRGIMPPLVGSERELDALARWICGRP